MRHEASRIARFFCDYIVSKHVIAVLFSLSLILASSCQLPWLRPGLIDDSTYRRAEAAFLRGNYDEAARDYGAYIAKSPSERNACEAYCKRGRARQALKQLDLARRDFERALENPPDDEVETYALIGLADCQRAAAQFEDAKKNYQRALKKFPDFAKQHEVPFKLGRAHQGLAEWDEAFEAFNSVLRESPTSRYVQDARTYLENKERYFSVQTGSFKQRASAENQRKELESKKFNSYIVTQRRGGETYHNIRVGHFSTWKSAKQEMLKLHRAGYTDAAIKP